MTHIKSNYVDNALWDDPKKIASREQGIIEIYRTIFSTALPIDQEYWAMCGAYFNTNGILKGELGQLVASGLITMDQFRGIDKEKEIIDKNRELYPSVQWFHGDFLKTLEHQCFLKKFNPGIINHDAGMQPKFGAVYLRKILMFLDNNVSNKLLLVANFVLNNPYGGLKKEFKPSDSIAKLKSLYYFPDHWSIVKYACAYKGSGSRSRTHLGMIMLVKDEHDPNNIKFTKGKNL